MTPIRDVSIIESQWVISLRLHAWRNDEMDQWPRRYLGVNVLCIFIHWVIHFESTPRSNCVSYIVSAATSDRSSCCITTVWMVECFIDAANYCREKQLMTQETWHSYKAIRGPRLFDFSIETSVMHEVCYIWFHGTWLLRWHVFCVLRW